MSDIIIRETPRIVRVVDNGRVVLTSVRPVLTVTGGGDDSTVTITAQTVLSALRVVTHDGRYADSSDLTTASRVAGVTVTAGAIGESVRVQTSGRMTDALWAWTPNAPVFVGANGALTQTEPTTGYLTRVGDAIDATTINIRIEQPIFRS